MMKYGNRKVEIDGITFDSAKEARRYQELKLLQRAGEIDDLQLQERFEIIPKTPGERAAYYTADFTYYDRRTGRLVVEDVKSRATKTEAYVLRRKLMAWTHGIKVQEV